MDTPLLVIFIFITAFLFLSCCFAGIYLFAFLKSKNEEEKDYKIRMLNMENEINKEKMKNVQPVEENDEDVVAIKLAKVETKTFEESLNDLSEESRGYLTELQKYAKKYENVNIFDRKYYQTITYGQRKTICKVLIQEGKLIVKSSLGKLKISKDVEPLKLKSIKIEVKDENSLAEAKKQIDLGYYKQSGTIKISMEEAKWLDLLLLI